MAEGASTIERGESVWTHDAVFVVDTPPQFKLSGWWIWTGIALFLVIMLAQAVLSPDRFSESTSAMTGIRWFVGGLIVVIAAFGFVIDLHQHLVRWEKWQLDLASAPASLFTLAAQCLRRVGIGNAPTFDGRRWLSQSGASGCRTIVIGGELPHIAWPGDEAEEADIGFGRERSSTSRRTSLYGGLLMLGLLVPIIAVHLATRTLFSPATLTVIGVLGLIATVSLLTAIGNTPIAVLTRQVSPGKVMFAGPLRTLEYTRADSVLVIFLDNSDRKPIQLPRIVLMHADGRESTLMLSGMDDPLLATVLSRWCYRPMNVSSSPSAVS